MKLIDYINRENLTFQAFAKRIGKKGPQSIHKYAHFESYPRPATAKKIVKATNNEVTLADIYQAQVRQ